MNRLCLLISLILLFQLVLIAQQTEYPTLWKAFLSVGYSDASPEDVSYYYDNIIDYYNAEGIPIPTQSKFGPSFFINGGILISRLESISFGLSLGYWYSSAYSGYKDQSGTLKIKGFVRSYEISIKFKTKVVELGDFPINISVQPGIAYAATYIKQEIRYYDYSQSNFDWKWSSSGWGPCFQSTLNSSIQLGKFNVSLEAGYRIAWNIVHEQKLEFTEVGQKRYDVFNIGHSGVIFLVSTEMRL